MKTIDSKNLKIPAEVLANLGEGETYALMEAQAVVAFLVPAGIEGSKRPFGLAKGEFVVPSDFNEPLPEIEAAFYGD